MPASISLIIPTYNGAQFIRHALESVFAQTQLPTEILVVDDNSTDDTLKVVEALTKDSPVPLIVIRLERNSGGPAVPINVGVEAASSDLIAILDQDDVCQPEKLESQARNLTQEPNATVVFSLCARLNHPGVASQSTAQIDELKRIGSRNSDGGFVIQGHHLLRLLLAQGNFVMGYPGFMFRRADWQTMGGADASLRICSDYDSLCWFASKGQAVFLPEIHYLRRVHTDNLSNAASTICREVARIRTKYWMNEKWLLQETSLANEMQTWFRTLAYWSRRNGSLTDAVTYHQLAGKVSGSKSQTAYSYLKLLVLFPFRRRISDKSEWWQHSYRFSLPRDTDTDRPTGGKDVHHAKSSRTLSHANSLPVTGCIASTGHSTPKG